MKPRFVSTLSLCSFLVSEEEDTASLTQPSRIQTVEMDTLQWFYSADIIISEIVTTAIVNVEKA